MNDRTAARAVGIFFIIATVAGLMAGVLQTPVLDAEDILAEVAANEARLATGALLEVVMAIGVIGIVVSITPILQRFSRRMSLGFVITRSIETVFYGFSVIGLLTLLTIGRETTDAGMGDALQATVLGGREWGNYTVQMIAFAISALLLNRILWTSGLVPRWLSGWGLGGGVLFLAVGPAVMYGLEPFSTTQVLMVAPLAIQEMAFALWLIAKGFEPVGVPAAT